MLDFESAGRAFESPRAYQGIQWVMSLEHGLCPFFISTVNIINT